MATTPPPPTTSSSSSTAGRANLNTTSTTTTTTSFSSSRNYNNNNNNNNNNNVTSRTTTTSSSRAPYPNSRRSVTPTSRSHPDNDSGRVRVAVRLRPRIAEDLALDADFADCVELQPELKRLKLRKNNWNSESYRFDEVFTETASQKRVYEVVAKPVVESALDGYNGTVMAYGQTGTGKTYTVGRLGKDDISERGIMVRALDDIISSTNPSSDVVEISYVQLYLETVQDLLAPERINISINEDPRTGEVSLPGATICRVRDLNQFLELMQVGEANRHAANTKQNTESSRSHAILMVHLRRSFQQKIQREHGDLETRTDGNDAMMPKVRKSKLLIVDLAGSERLDKSGSEGHLLEEAKFINLSLSSLGKCINALAENSAHIPTRDSKLTRVLRDSFGGSARTSLIVTIGPSARHHAETTSTIMFGQRAMKIVNMVKLKEEFDYESLCRKLETQVDHITADLEREQKYRQNEKHALESRLKECQDTSAETERILGARFEALENENASLLLEMKEKLKELEHQKGHNELLLNKVAQIETSLKLSQQEQLESSTYQNVLADTTQMYEKKIAELSKQLEVQRSFCESAEQQMDSMRKLLNDTQESIKQYEVQTLTYQKALADTTQRYEEKIAELMRKLESVHTNFDGAEEHFDRGQESEVQEAIEMKIQLEKMHQLHENTQTELHSLKSDYKVLLQEKEALNQELSDMRQKLLVEEEQRMNIEQELVKLKKSTPENDHDFEGKRSLMKENIGKGSSSFGTPKGLHKSNSLRETLAGQRATIAKICEEVGLQKILQLLASEDTDVQVQAVKVIANLAAEDINQENIVEEGGLEALLMLLKSSQNTTILRVASGAIANLAMNEVIQGLIVSKGGAELLAKTASKTDDPQTLRMVAGALANLCGNERLHMMLKEDGGIKALLELASSRNNDIVAQVARGVANFAKCESRGIIQGHRKGRSLLIDDGALGWLISNCKTTPSASTQRHLELALCHLAQNKDNIKDFTSSGGLQELVRISVESNREDIRNLAKKILNMYP